MRLFRLFAVGAVVAGAMVGVGAAPANAAVMCEEVTVSSAVPKSGPPLGVSYCQPYDNTLCQGLSVGANPPFLVDALVCVPLV